MIELQFNPPIIAHRGASGYAPENTLAAFTKAAQLGIHWVEFDVMLSEDNVPIVFHDDDLDRTTNGKGFVGYHPFSYLESLDAGAWFRPRFAGERIPSLQQVLEFLVNANMAANVEIKPLPEQDEKTAYAALKQVSAFFPQPSPSILFSSFSVEALRYLRMQSPNCLIGLLMHEELPDWPIISTELSCVSIHVNQEIMTPTLARAIKQQNKKLLCYTVNDPMHAKELYSWGVDAIFSDIPDQVNIVR